MIRLFPITASHVLHTPKHARNHLALLHIAMRYCLCGPATETNLFVKIGKPRTADRH